MDHEELHPKKQVKNLYPTGSKHARKKLTTTTGTTGETSTYRMRW
jgi:hypothetical protein